ncbi:hypothetical protein BH09BAC1_BH09BAC1_02510 [soil metagenome]
MKRVFLLAVSLSIICMVVFTKWRYVAVVDAPEYTVHGFPLPHTIACFHTSLCTQVFVKAMLLNFLVHLVFWCLLLGLAKRFLPPIAWGKWLAIAVYSIALIIIVPILAWLSITENVYLWEPHFQWEVLHSGMETIFTCGGSYHK